MPWPLGHPPYALTHWDSIDSERGKDLINKNPMNYQQIIKKDENQAPKFFSVKVHSFSNLIDSIQKALWQDSQYRSIFQDLGEGKSDQDYSLYSSSQLLLIKDWVVFPNDPTIKLNILQKWHESPPSEPPGKEKTFKLVKHDFDWSGMTQFIKDYVSSCQQCSRNKNIHHKKSGLLKTLPIKLKISRDLSTTYHIETDGHTERVNKIPQQYTPIYASYHQHYWNTWIPMAKFSYNNSDHSSTKQSMFFTFYGKDPHFDSVHITQDTSAGMLSTKFQSVQQDVKRELEVSINRFKGYADKSRASPPVFNPGDMA
ncbi:hypothetical protein O181_026534 [Austropuccinia psidii MF-1]|uniref:Integrase zinc-binding domain-containing protein n=1 Tax=Austropuccinia psidii MF-1 TaxID=1389203 RepID=A0A9Q3H1Q1_9BASI|nr:hypothetical protein [Austropuccinia psidii MF-1]